MAVLSIAKIIIEFIHFYTEIGFYNCLRCFSKGSSLIADGHHVLQMERCPFVNNDVSVLFLIFISVLLLFLPVLLLLLLL